MARQDAWSASWVAKNVTSNTRITAAREIGDHLVELSVGEIDSPVFVATSSVDPLTAFDLTAVCEDERVEFLVNIKKDAVIAGSALYLAEVRGIGIGGIGDLYSAVGHRDLRGYVASEVAFILRGLQQHTRVSSVERINNKIYSVSRRSLAPISVLALHDYDMTADALRSGLEKYGNCDVVLAANPNSRISSGCYDAAKNSGVHVLKWGELLGALNH